MIQVICSLLLCDLCHLYFITVSVLSAKYSAALCQLEYDFSICTSVFSLDVVTASWSKLLPENVLLPV